MKTHLLLPLILALFILVGCGGEPAPPEPTVFDYALTTEFTFDPASMTVKTDAPIKINLDNSAGGVSHSWVLVPATVSTSATPEELEALSIGSASNSGEIAAGDSGSITFNAPAPGEYKYVCAIGGHLAGGMIGDLTVTE